MTTFKLAPDMGLGVSTAPAQIEGGDVDHNWNDWSRKGHIKDGSSPQRANRHFEHWREDLDSMAEMGIRHYRLGLEWARLEPAEGQWDQDAVRFYRRLLKHLKKRGIKPLVTLHHFTNPMWFEKRGGFADEYNIPCFLRYVAFAIRAFGDLAAEYITINEPNVYAVLGYWGGGFPPGVNSVGQTVKVMSVLAACHIRAYQLIHRRRRAKGYTDTKVGFAHHARVFAPENPHNPLHQSAAALTAWLFQDALAQACLTGRFRPPLQRFGRLPRGEYSDFLGLNYYTRSTVRGIGDGMAASGAKNDLGWEIYPPGIVMCARKLSAYLPRPLYITENGTCDNQDTFRSRYICEHLAALSGSELPVKRYYHWCFIDNFEWLEGESARFGLVHLDYESQRRTIKKSGEFYQKIIAQRGVTPELYNQYVAGEEYHQ